MKILIVCIYHTYCTYSKNRNKRILQKFTYLNIPISETNQPIIMDEYTAWSEISTFIYIYIFNYFINGGNGLYCTSLCGSPCVYKLKLNNFIQMCQMQK